MNYFKIHLLYFFRYVILNIGDGLMKIRCEMCGKKFDPDDARSRYDSEWGRQLGTALATDKSYSISFYISQKIQSL